MKMTERSYSRQQDGSDYLPGSNERGFALLQVFILATMISVLLSSSLLLLNSRRKQNSTLDEAATRDNLAQVLATTIKSPSNLAYSIYDYNATSGQPMLASARIQGGSIGNTPARFMLLASEESFAANPNLGTWIAQKRIIVPTSSGRSLSMVKLTDLGSDTSGTQSYYNTRGEPCIGPESGCVMIAEAFVSRNGSMSIGTQSINQIRFEVRLRPRPESQLTADQARMQLPSKEVSIQNQVLESELNQVSRMSTANYDFVGLRVGGTLQPGMIQTGVTFQGGSEVATGIFELGATPCSTDTLHVGTTFSGYPRCAGAKNPCPNGQVMVGFFNTGSGPQVQCRAMNNCESVSGKPGAMIPLITDVGTTSCLTFGTASGCESQLKTTINSNGKLTCGNAVCTPGAWTPTADQVCAGQTFTQIDPNGCVPSITATGTRNCGNSCPVDTPWTPLVTDVCSGESYVQSRCGVTRSATGTKNCNPVCVDSSWTPDLSNTCPSATVVQTSNCGRTRTMNGTRVETWSPDPATVCSTAPPFEQISTCGSRRTANGTMTCSVPNCTKPNNYAPSSFSCSPNGTGYSINAVCPAGTAVDNSDVLRQVLGNECNASAAPTSVGNLFCCAPSTSPPPACGGSVYMGPARQDQCVGSAIQPDGFASNPRVSSALTLLDCPANQKLVCDPSKQQFMQFNTTATPPTCGFISGQDGSNKTTFYLPGACSCQNAAECGTPPTTTTTQRACISDGMAVRTINGFCTDNGDTFEEPLCCGGIARNECNAGGGSGGNVVCTGSVSCEWIIQGSDGGQDPAGQCGCAPDNRGNQQCASDGRISNSCTPAKVGQTTTDYTCTSAPSSTSTWSIDTYICQCGSANPPTSCSQSTCTINIDRDGNISNKNNFVCARMKPIDGVDVCACQVTDVNPRAEPCEASAFQ